VSKDLKDQSLSENFVPLILKLAAAPFFTSRASAAGLFSVGFKRLPAHQEELKTLFIFFFFSISFFLLPLKTFSSFSAFSKLCHDDTPMVRRAAATHLKVIIAF